MQNQELRKFVQNIVEEKKLTGVEQDVIDELVDDLSKRLEAQINRALIDELTDEQFKEFEGLVDQEDTQKLSTYFTDKGVPVQNIVTNVMTKFRIAYLGS